MLIVKAEVSTSQVADIPRTPTVCCIYIDTLGATARLHPVSLYNAMCTDPICATAASTQYMLLY